MRNGDMGKGLRLSRLPVTSDGCPHTTTRSDPGEGRGGEGSGGWEGRGGRGGKGGEGGGEGRERRGVEGRGGGINSIKSDL